MNSNKKRPARDEGLETNLFSAMGHTASEHRGTIVHKTTKSPGGLVQDAFSAAKKAVFGGRRDGLGSVAHKELETVEQKSMALPFYGHTSDPENVGEDGLAVQLNPAAHKRNAGWFESDKELKARMAVTAVHEYTLHAIPDHRNLASRAEKETPQLQHARMFPKIHDDKQGSDDSEYMGNVGRLVAGFSSFSEQGAAIDEMSSDIIKQHYEDRGKTNMAEHKEMVNHVMRRRLEMRMAAYRSHGGIVNKVKSFFSK